MTSLEFFNGIRDNAFYVGFMFTLGVTMMNAITGVFNGIIQAYVQRKQREQLERLAAEFAKRSGNGNQ